MMSFSCREHDAMKLEELLAAGETSMRVAGVGMGRCVRYVHSLVKQWPMRFSCVGIAGPVGSWCIGLAGDRPIHLILSEAAEKAKGG